MIEKTEYGVLISYEKWEEIQDKLENSQDAELQKENKALKNVLRKMNYFLTQEAI